MNVKEYMDNWWRREVLRIVRAELARREPYDNQLHDPADDSMLYEDLILALFPPDGKDCRKKDAKDD